MNKHDQDNLRFLLTASKETLQDWYSQINEDDLAYAMELLDAYSKELDQRQVMNSLDDAIESLESNFDDPYAEANAALAKFRL